jgi:ABC-2 type transport system permease protein
MASRIATGDAAAWQVFLAVAFMLAAIVAMNRLAARIYVNSVLRVGWRVALSQAWRGSG